MAKITYVLNRLPGKIVCLHGKFSYGVKEQLGAKAQAQGGKVVEDLDAKVDFLILQDTSGGVGIQKKAQALNARGAAIQIMAADAFEQTVAPTEADMLALIRGGKKNVELMASLAGSTPHYQVRNLATAMFAFVGEKFDGLDLTGMSLSHLSFDACSFVGANLERAGFGLAKGCDFRKCQGKGAAFDDVSGSQFGGARLPHAEFRTIDHTDFTDAHLEQAKFDHNTYRSARGNRPVAAGLVFRNAFLQGARLANADFRQPDFAQADLTGAVMLGSSLAGANFKGAILHRASLVDSKLTGANFTGANLTSANLAGADLTDAVLTSADLAHCNLRGAVTKGVNLSKAKNVAPVVAGTVGPALTELDTLATGAKQIGVTFKLHSGPGDEGEEVGVNSAYFKWGRGIRWPISLYQHQHHRQSQSFSDAMLQLANAMGHKKVRYETVEVESTKSAKGGKDLRDLFLKGIEEAFAQPIPAEAELAAATKLYREADREKNAAAREEREKARAAAEKAKAAEVKKVEKKIEKAVGKVTDTATFLKALELRIEEAKISKATSMLKKSGFQLYNDVTDEFMSGVVKSQTDPDLVYACRIKSDGSYSCCTQNLNVCGGLRGSICKHLLVLIIGLVQADKLDPNTIDGWVAKSNTTKPVLDKEIMGEIFIRYKGAEAGEVDWRPTETMPEDYYAL